MEKGESHSTDHVEPAGYPPDQASFVLDLRQLGRGDLERVGGKGANLGELVRAGLPVPAGFVVTTAAYDPFVAQNRLLETIARALREESGSGSTIRAAFEAAPIPGEVERDILLAYDRLGRGPVAVRSSATAEDLPEAAFAGQQDTFLNVLSAEALLDSTRRCWASLWTDRAIAYRARLGLDHRNVKLAVVVQRMVGAEVAGVLFTANPITGARNEMIVDANPGLGEAVVAGLVTPDHVILRKWFLGWRIAERRAGKHDLVVQARAGGGTEHVTCPAVADQVLPDHALRRLARLGAAIERHFRGPQDVEWAWANGEFFIVQARPITALPAPLPLAGRAKRLMAGLLAELVPERPYPLEFTTWMPAVYGFLARFSAVLGLRALPLHQLFVEEDGVVVRLSGRVPFRPTPRILLALIRLVWLARRHDPVRWQTDRLLGEAQARTRALETRDLRALSWNDLLATVHEALSIPALIWELRVRYLLPPILAVGQFRLLLTLLRRGDLFGKLLFAGIETRTLEANRALERLAERIRSDPTLADLFARHEATEVTKVLEEQPRFRTFLAELRAFLDEYGHREAGGTMQVSRPTWKDAPEVVVGMLQGLARSKPREPTQRPGWEMARDELLRHPFLRFPPVRRRFLNLLDRARRFPQLREDTRFYFMLPLPVLRRTLLEMGRRLVEVGVVDTPDDVFHFKLDELERIGTWPPSAHVVGGLRALVARRRAKRAELQITPLVDPRLFGRADARGEVLLRGNPGSPGIAEGPACVVHDSSEFGKLRAGDVLVAPYTNPAWTPLFERAAAVVVDSGGPASHAAIVAREYGIPAVMATVDGTRRLADNQLVRVDGGAGLILKAGFQNGSRPIQPLDRHAT
jgi:rifampicin phosphotransferase